MSRFRLVRYGVASVMATGMLGVLASCVSGTDTSGSGTDFSTGGQQGSAASGNSSGYTAAAQGGSIQAASGGQFGSSGGSPSSGGSSAQQGGSTSIGGTSAGGASSTSVGGSSAGGSGPAGAGSPGTGGMKSAGGSTSAGGSPGAGGGTTGPQPLPAITGGSSGFATRYWDCCKPACGGSKLSCSSNSSSQNSGGSACSGGSAYMCYSFAPFQDSTNPYIGYAYAASHRSCNSCYEIQFTGKAGCSEGASCPGVATGLVYKTLYVQVINTGDIKDDQFDLLIPGGGVGQYNACSNEWGTSDLGSTYGGFFSACKNDVSCTQTKCNSVFANKPDLLAGCNWFLGWYTAADNPQISFKQVSCPKALTDKSGLSG